MGWCRQPTSHYLNNADPELCRHMASLGQIITYMYVAYTQVYVEISINIKGKLSKPHVRHYPYWSIYHKGLQYMRSIDGMNNKKSGKNYGPHIADKSISPHGVSRPQRFVSIS